MIGIPNFISRLYATAEDNPPLIQMIVTKKGSVDETHKKVEVTFRDRIFPVVFDIVNKRYNILTGIKIEELPAFARKTENIEIQDLNLTNWTQLEALPDNDNDLKILACSIITTTQNYKAVRFFRWSARQVSDLTTKAYNSPNFRTAVMSTLVATTLTTVVVAYKRSCEFTPQPPSPINVSTFNSPSPIVDNRTMFRILFDSCVLWLRTSRLNYFNL